MRIVTIITVAFFAQWTMDMQFNKHAVTLQWCKLSCMGGNAGECRSLTSVRGRTCFPLILMLPLSFNTNYEGITVGLSCNNSSKDLVLRSSCRVPHFIEAFH